MALPPLLLMVFCLFRAAAVTEKCSRAPALVNSLVVEEDVMDDARQYLVQYIEHSAAGFYIKGRLFALQNAVVCPKGSRSSTFPALAKSLLSFFTILY